jgi:branched-chain amino acid aminotransferase
MQNAVINVNGQIFSREEANTSAAARISAFDRAYLYGDSLYEVCRTYGGKLFALQEHLERMEKSADLCRMKFSQPLSVFAAEMERTLAEWRKRGNTQAEGYVRIIVSRGTGRIGFGSSCVDSPTLFTIIAQKLDEPTDAQLTKGYAYQISHRLRNDPRALDPAMKSGNYLNSLLAYLEATEPKGPQGGDGGRFDDALLCNHEGFLTEGTTFNIGYIRRGILATPPLDIGILDGITRRRLIHLCGELGVPVREVRFPRERMFEADEVFMCSTIKEVFPVTRIDDKKIGNGKPGPLTLKLRQAFRESVEKELGLSR